MNTLFIISNFPPVVGGTERQAFLLAKALRRQGVDVAVLTRYWPGLRRKESLEEVSIHRHALPLRGKLGSVLAALSWAAFVLRHGHQYQVFHAHQPYSALWIALLGKFLWRGRMVVKIGGTAAVEYLKESWLKQAVAKRYVDALVVVNHDHREILCRVGFPSAKIQVIPNGVDAIAFRPPSSDRYGSDKKHSVVFVGRLIPTKGVDVLLDSWRTIEDQEGLSFHLHIIGDGPERDRLQHQARDLSLKRVHFTGMVENVQPYLESAIACVNPSKREGLSNALLEAMAAGLPIVATEIEGTRDIVHNGENGLLFKPGSPEALTSALLKLLQDSGLRERLGRQARETVEEAYSIEIVAQKYCALYASLA